MTAKKFSRDQFKATKVEVLKEQQEEVESIIKTKGSDRAKVLDLKKDGTKNKLRIFPKHPGTRVWTYPRSVHFLKVALTDKDGNPIKDDNGKQKIGKKPIFNSRVHGNTQKDIIDEYINFVYKKAYDEIQDDDTRKKYLRPIEGWREAGRYHPGIKAQTRYIIYGNLNGVNGRIELPVSVKNKLNEIAAGQDDDDGVITVDPFTGVDDGRKVFITFHKDEKDPAKKYQVAIDLKGPTPLTDEQFEWLAEQTPLEELYVNVYRYRDFMLAMEGLKRFDEESAEVLRQFGFSSGYEVFTYDEFLDVAEEIAGYYSDDDDEVDDDVTDVNENDDMQSDDDDLPFDVEPSIDEMNMRQLKAYIKEKQLSIRILPSYTVQMVRQFIREEQEMLEAEQQSVESDDVPGSSDIGVDKAGSRLKKLRNKVKK